MLSHPIRLGCAALALASLLAAQHPVVVPPGFGAPADKLNRPPEQANPAPTQAPQRPSPTKQAAPVTVPQTDGAGGPATGSLNLDNASLTTVIDLLARQLKINYVLDPKVQGTVTLFTYGETKAIDTRALLDLVLRINGFTMVQNGPVYRIVPLADAASQPLAPEEKLASQIPPDDRVRLNLVFLKYVNADELSKLLEPFLGQGGKIYTYAPANLLMVLDSGRNMRRTMDLIAMFDNDTLAGQRVRLFDVKNARPADLAKDLDKIFKSISLNEKASTVKFLPLDRINTLIAIASNPGVFGQVSDWVKKLDIAVSTPAGTLDNYVYRVKYGRAEFIGMAVMSLYMGGGMMGMMSMMGMMGMMGGMGGMGGGMYGAGMYGGGMYGSAGMYSGMGGMGGMGGMYGGGMGGMYGGGMYGGGMYGGGMYGANPMFGAYPNSVVSQGIPPTAASSTPVPASGVGATSGTSSDQTGQYLSASAGQPTERMPHIMPNPMDNTILIQATPEQYQSVLRLLKQLDVPPRQVLIEAKIVEVSLTGAFASGVSAYLQRLGSTGSGAANIAHQFQASLVPPATTLTAGLLIGKSRELLGALSLSENATKTKTLSEPSVIATDSIPASINVGEEVPTLTAQAVTGVQQGGNSLFANSIANRSTGVTLNIMARVNPSGVVTLVINQEVSSPQAPSSTSAIQSPSFSKRTVQTQVTVEDGDTIAIGGIISENNGMSTAGVPLLNRIPILGAAFGNRSYSRSRTELVVFLTPRVIYDTAQIQDASEELKSKFRKLQRDINQ